CSNWRKPSRSRRSMCNGRAIRRSRWKGKAKPDSGAVRVAAFRWRARCRCRAGSHVARALDAESERRAIGKRDEMDLKQIEDILEAVLLVAGEPLPVGQLSKLFDPPLEADVVRNLLDGIREKWNGRNVELVQVASGWRFHAKAAMPQVLEPRAAANA